MYPRLPVPRTRIDHIRDMSHGVIQEVISRSGRLYFPYFHKMDIISIDVSIYLLSDDLQSITLLSYMCIVYGDISYIYIVVHKLCEYIYIYNI